VPATKKPAAKRGGSRKLPKETLQAMAQANQAEADATPRRRKRGEDAPSNPNKVKRGLAKSLTNHMSGNATAEDYNALKQLYDAAQLALASQVDMGKLMELRNHSIKSMGAFTRKIGEIIMQTGETPLEFLIGKMRDPGVDVNIRVRCAESALPYIHQRLPALDSMAEEPADMLARETGRDALASFSVEELNILERMARKMSEKDVTPIDVKVKH